MANYIRQEKRRCIICGFMFHFNGIKHKKTCGKECSRKHGINIASDYQKKKKLLSK